MWRWIKGHVGATILIAAVLIYAAYEASTYLFVYTEDAYVTTNVVFVAPQVAGQLRALHVKRDQAVKEGDVLFALDTAPLEAALERYGALEHEAKVALTAARDRAAEAAARVTEREAAMQAAGGSAATLQDQDAEEDDVPPEVLAARRVHEAVRDATEAKRSVLRAEAALRVASARVSDARWALEQATVSAPTSGRIGPATAQEGDYIKVGQPVLALVSDEDWRIVANVRERFLDAMAPGQTVWFTLASEPWTWRRGEVRALPAGIARTPDDEKVLPYVDPNTDWIRLPRRFPVEIDLMGLERERRLYQGADASVLVFF